MPLASKRSNYSITYADNGGWGTRHSTTAAHAAGNGGQVGKEPPLNDPIYNERPMKIICIGAGASGLVFAYKLQRSFENFDLTVYEKNEEVSGTWYENRYPG